MSKILRQSLAKHPFQPITVVMSNGTSIVIEHAEFAVVLVQAGFLYVELPHETEPHFLNLRQIADVRVKDLVLDEPDEA